MFQQDFEGFSKILSPLFFTSLLFSFNVDPINVFREAGSWLADGCGVCFCLVPTCIIGIELTNFVVSALVLARIDALVDGCVFFINFLVAVVGASKSEVEDAGISNCIPRVRLPCCRVVVIVCPGCFPPLVPCAVVSLFVSSFFVLLLS